MSDLVLKETIERGIVAVTLNRPDRRNALSVDLLERLCSTIDELSSDPSLRVAIMRGAGTVFSAGLDLHEAADTSLIDRSAAAISRVLDRLRTSPVVMIAAVQGGAFAGGAGLMAACDIVIAATDAKIGFPEVRRGLLPALISDVLRYKVREGDLRELFLAGETIDAIRAREIGLVQRVVPADQLFNEAVSIARSVARGGPQTIRQTKTLLNGMFQPAADQSGPDLVETHLTARHSAEAREGLAAFAEKREPKWS
ncbi:MAG TPA: enoyl-CoA hydratase/isomerase family protein [Lacipirellulaceae bacterium]|nr:enoyl-CoA hydratase/isomerase family protein [Lacipirellulaceae bacterium]